MKKLGLIGGTSWHSTIEYYRYINQAINNLKGGNTNPPLILYNLNQKQIHELQVQGRWDIITEILSDAGKSLIAAGAEALLFCANTPHKVYPEVQDNVSVPILHIADATARAIKSNNIATVGLIGTIYTMEEPFLKDWISNKHGINTLVPADKEHRKELHRVIQEELSLGIFTPASKKYVVDEINKLKHAGAKGTILGCTEFPLIISETDINIPVFNTTLLHAQYAVEYIIGSSSES